MRGDLDFAESLRARVRLLAGLDDGAARRRTPDDLVLAPGARTFVRTLKRLDYRIAIVSGGFTQVTDALVADLGIDYSAANTLEIVDGRLTGELLGPVVDRAGKADGAGAVRRARPASRSPRPWRSATAPTTSTCWPGPGSGIAYNAKPVVRVAADAALNVPYLDAILFLLGISRDGDRGGRRRGGHRGARAADLTEPRYAGRRRSSTQPCRWLPSSCDDGDRRPAAARAGPRSGSSPPAPWSGCARRPPAPATSVGADVLDHLARRRPGRGPGPTTTSAAGGQRLGCTRRPGLLGPASPRTPRRGRPGPTCPASQRPAAAASPHARER